jgi:hypothetical protein
MQSSSLDEYDHGHPRAPWYGFVRIPTSRDIDFVCLEKVRVYHVEDQSRIRRSTCPGYSVRELNLRRPHGF